MVIAVDCKSARFILNRGSIPLNCIFFVVLLFSIFGLKSLCIFFMLRDLVDIFRPLRDIGIISSVSDGIVGVKGLIEVCFVK